MKRRFVLLLLLPVSLLLGLPAAQAQVPSNVERIHYHRFDNNYAGWTVYAFNDTTEDTGNFNGGPVQVTGTDSFGAYFDVGLKPNAQDLGFIIHLVNAKDPGPDQHVNPQTQGHEIWVISGSTTIYTSQPVIPQPGPVAANKERIHYHRFDNTYSGWTLFAFGNTTENTSDFNDGPLQPAGIDSYGVYFDVGLTSGATDLGFIIHFGGSKDPGPDEHVNPQTQGREIWVISGSTTIYAIQPTIAAPGPVAADHERIHYHRTDGVYAGWTVYAFGNTTENTNDFGDGPVQPSGIDSYGIFFDVGLTANATDLGFIIHRSGEKDPGPDQHVNPQTQGHEIWIISGSTTIFTTQPTGAQLLAGLLGRLQAVWIDSSTIALPPSAVQAGNTYSLASDPTASLVLSTSGVSGGTTYALTQDAAGLTPQQLAEFPQLHGYRVFHLPALEASVVDSALKGELIVYGVNGSGQLVYVTQVQTYGMLDDLFAYQGTLGAVIEHGSIAVKVWAPTAQSIALELFDSANQTVPSATIPMKEENGVWSALGNSTWKNKYYLFDVHVYVPSAQKILENLVTDPYSLALSLNSQKSQIVDLEDHALEPPGWDGNRAPQLKRLNDLSIYELHIRDFSASDESVPAALRGTYLAFANPDSDGMRHLRQLAKAGLKAVHLLPSFDIASVNEDKSTWKDPGDLTTFAPDSAQQQAAVQKVKDQDGFNWGYDPWHFLAPEGSYAVNADDRIREYRAMVMGLHRAGLRVVLDQVFNHTSAAGQDPKSVFDQIVPNYYYRLNPDGQIYSGSCCPDTASEHVMMEKLMIDALVTSAKEYKIDGFRFDIMSFHSVPTMQRIQQALRGLTMQKDGVDGSKIYLYGEGFNFGEVANNAFFVNASQVNLYGNGIGSFNDRIRDGIRGGNPFGDLREQGFATGLFTDPNPNFSFGDQSTQKARLLHEADWVRVGLAGNLRDFQFTDSNGDTVTGAQVDYQGQPTGYGATPIESINYASVHDNQTLFDAVQLKSPLSDSLDQRVRRQNLAMSLVALGQGVPFFLAGDDLLRSKSMDKNSYNSGDWFNRLDFTYQADNWGVGLPVQTDNGSDWPIEQPLLADAAIRPGPNEIASSREWFQELLRIRNSSNLFRMGTLAEIQANLQFLNTGPSQIPGLIVMKLHNPGAKTIVVVFNGSTQTQIFQNDALKNLNLQLHPALRASSDSVVKQSTYANSGTVTVPELTTAVFVSQGFREDDKD
ncbi:MAG TPA: pullulanase-type alpha-1,6-glucosidase [Terriglobales bacterium]|nr:pullulanase-type alpha-1,6-glucosidase [Terriglobales bacterium]